MIIKLIHNVNSLKKWEVLGIGSPLGYSAIGEAAATINQLGLLDCLLAVIAKALSVQVKVKGRSSNILQVNKSIHRSEPPLCIHMSTDVISLVVQ